MRRPWLLAPVPWEDPTAQTPGGKVATPASPRGPQPFESKFNNILPARLWLALKVPCEANPMPQESRELGGDLRGSSSISDFGFPFYGTPSGFPRTPRGSREFPRDSPASNSLSEGYLFKQELRVKFLLSLVEWGVPESSIAVCAAMTHSIPFWSRCCGPRSDCPHVRF